MDDFEKLLNEQLRNPDFRTEWEAIQPEMAIAQAMISAREKNGITQQKLSEATGIAQSDISKMEHGSGNPSLKTLQRLAAGLGMVLKIEFIPTAKN